jgi:hypothetical protein
MGIQRKSAEKNYSTLCVFALKICADDRGIGGRAKESVTLALAGRHICRIHVVNEFKLRQERNMPPRRDCILRPWEREKVAAGRMAAPFLDATVSVMV